MSIHIPISLSAQIVGDGVSTSFAVDFQNDLKVLSAFNTPFVPSGCPLTLLSFSGSPTPASAVLNGTVVTFTYTTAPPVSLGYQSVSVTLGF